MIATQTRHGAALLGCAIGDCTGLPFENVHAPPPSWVPQALPDAHWSDDTQQSLVLVDEYLRHGALDARRMMDRFVAYRNIAGGRYGLHRGTGRGFRHAVDFYAEHGVFGPDPGRAGNGAAMRVPSVAYLMPDSEASVAQVLAVSSATHLSPYALDAALAVVYTAWLLRDHPASPAAALAAIAARLPQHPEDAVDGAARSGPPCVARVLATLAACAEGTDRLALLSATTGMPAGDGHALGGPLAAIVIALETESLFACVHRAVAVGGDTDSTAAIAGALCAGAHGVDEAAAALLVFGGVDGLRQWDSNTAPADPEAACVLETAVGATRHKKW